MKDLDKRATELISRFVKEKLGRVSPLWYERLYSLPSEAKNDRELKILMLAVHYALIQDARSVNYIERLFFNWQEYGVPRWALKRLAAADPPWGGRSCWRSLVIMEKLTNLLTSALTNTTASTGVPPWEIEEEELAARVERIKRERLMLQRGETPRIRVPVIMFALKPEAIAIGGFILLAATIVVVAWIWTKFTKSKTGLLWSRLVPAWKSGVRRP